MFQQVSAPATGLRRKALTTAVALASVTAVGVTFLLSASVSSHVPPPPLRAGDPLPGLTAPQLQAFVDGLDEFTNSETPEGGLGPLFNQTLLRGVSQRRWAGRIKCGYCHPLRPHVAGRSL